jgi:biopolymer transport protein TolR
MGASVNGGGRPSGGRRGRARRGSPMSEINVTPMVDVMLVLLVIFMVTAPLMTAGVPLDLPSARGPQLETQNKEPLVLSVAKDGKIFLGQEEKIAVKIDEIGPKLKAVAAARGGADEPIFVRGDKLVDYGTMARVMARIKEAGFRKLSLVTEGESGG